MSNKENTAKKPRISIIAVISKDKRALGIRNGLLWKIEGDLPRFKAITTGHPIIMGRLTYESIGKPLPNRTNIIVSKSGTIPQTENLIITSSIEDAIKIAESKNMEEIFIIGGGKIFAETIEKTDRLYLTLVDNEPTADTFFPDYAEFTKEIKKEEHTEHNPPFTYIILEK